MKPPARNGFELCDVFSFLKRREHRAKLCFVLPSDTPRLIPSPESFKVFVPETDDAHIEVYGITVHMST